jgi:signal transduction histidine kinase
LTFLRQEILAVSTDEAWRELLSSKLPVFFVNREGFQEALSARDPAVVVLGKKQAQEEDWALCRTVRRESRALIAVIQEEVLAPPVKTEWVDDLLDPASGEESVLRLENLLRIAEANACYFERQNKDDQASGQVWERFFTPDDGLLPPFRVTGVNAFDSGTVENFVRLLTNLLGTTASFIPVSSLPYLTEKSQTAPIESVGSLYCQTVAGSPVRIGGVSPCRYSRWLAGMRAVVERRPVTLSCPGGLTLYACPVNLEFFRVSYPLGALVVGVGDVPFDRELIRIGQQLRISIPLLRERAGITRAQMLKTERLAARQLIDSAADYLLREASYGYNVAYQEFIRATACRQLERVYEANNRSLPAALEKAEKLAAMGKLAAGLIHEIRNPLTSVRGFIQLLTEKKAPDDREREYLDVVLSEIDRVNEIIRNFLYLTRVGGFRPVVTKLDPVVKDILLVVESQAVLKEIKLNTDFDPRTPEVSVDTEQIKQVLLNLIQNAFQAMPYGGELTVRLYPDPSEEWVVLEVADTGVGIPAEHFSRLGEAFFTTKEDGTGLGLAISYRLVEDHGGKIEVQSEEGKGTRFLVKLPVAAKAENAGAGRISRENVE